MVMKRKNQRLLVLCVAIAILAFGYYKLSQAHKEFLESKMIHETTATVISKEDFRANEKEHFYVNGYGDRVEMQPGEQQKRVYYQIDNFDTLAEPRHGTVIESEKRRLAEFGPRFTYAVDWYERVKPGDKIQVSYRVSSVGQIEVWSVEKEK